MIGLTGSNSHGIARHKLFFHRVHLIGRSWRTKVTNQIIPTNQPCTNSCSLSPFPVSYHPKTHWKTMKEFSTFMLEKVCVDTTNAWARAMTMTMTYYGSDKDHVHDRSRHETLSPSIVISFERRRCLNFPKIRFKST